MSNSVEVKQKVSFLNRFLNAVEIIGNKLPHPIVLFGIFAIVVVVLSGLCSSMGFSESGYLVNRKTGGVELQTIKVISLLNGKGFAYMLTKMVTNFTGFAPLGTVLVAMLGVGVAESSGYISSLLKRTVEITPRRLITPVIVFLGVMSNIAGDAGYVVLIPIGALMFLAYGRHPLAGLAAAFAGVSGGFSANLLIGTLDPLLTGITNEAIKIIDPNYVIYPTCNWYFMAASTFLITIVGTLITDKLIEPRLGTYQRSESLSDIDVSTPLDDVQKRALKWGNLSFVAMVVGLILLALPQNSFLRNPSTGSLIDKAPLMDGIIPIVMAYFMIPAIVYGKMAGTFKSHRDVCKAMGKSMAMMSSYTALIVVSSQFIAYFKYTQMGTVLALKGAKLFASAGLHPIVIMVLFVFFSASANLLMGSASAKWTFLAPVFVPMFMLLGFSPELVQCAYRIGDSCTNVITPLMSQFVTIVVFTRRYDDKAGIGTLTSMMLPYSMSFLFTWTILLMIWMGMGWPIGPGARLMLH